MDARVVDAAAPADDRQLMLYARDLARLHRLQRAYERLVPSPLDLEAPHAWKPAVRAATIMVTHLHSFAGVTERFADDPVGLRSVLNEHLGPVVRSITRCGGVVEQVFGGDVMATFGARADLPGHQERSLAAALGLLRATDRLNRRCAEPWGFRLEVSVGLAAGTVLAGLIGPPERSEMTVVGDCVTIATRLANEAAPGQALLAASVYHSLGDNVRAELVGRQAVHGRAREVEVYGVTAWQTGTAGSGNDLEPPSAGDEGRLRVDAPARTVWRGAQLLPQRLSVQEFRLLAYLYEHRDRVCTREQIGDEIWGASNWYPNMLHRLVRRLKEKLEVDPERPRYVQTVPWVGYRLAA